MNQQQDSQEFLTFLLGCFDNEISKKVIYIPGRLSERLSERLPERLPERLSERLIEKNISSKNISSKNISISLIQILANNMWQQFIKNEYSPIKTLFTGMNRITTKCIDCNNYTNNFDIFQTLQLSIPLSTNLKQIFTLEECLMHYIKEEKLDKDNMVKCQFCYKKNRSIKQTKLWKTPHILIIHLKRFITDCYGAPIQKINNMVQYPIDNLDITQYLDQMSPNFNTSTKYNLFAVNCHHTLSNSINFGHYTSMVKSRLDKKWYHYDDSNMVVPITKVNRLVNSNAYMLFYELV